MRFSIACATLLLWFLPAYANVEKTVFLAPAGTHVPAQHPNLDDLHLDVLSPLQWSLRRQLQAEFPTHNATKGIESWYLLDGLHAGQRYEVRICWRATVCWLIAPSSPTVRQHTQMTSIASHL